MLRGYIDTLFTSGFLEGWARDDTKALAPLSVAVLTSADEEIARGFADQHRDDLALAGQAYGWCAFRLALSVPAATVAGRPLQLVEATTRAAISMNVATTREAETSEILDLDALVAADPTALRSGEPLEAFAPVLEGFVAAYGVEAFVDAAYVYALERPADGPGLASFVRLLRSRRLTPYGVLRALVEGAEFVERGRTLIPPTRPGFPFLPA